MTLVIPNLHPSLVIDPELEKIRRDVMDNDEVPRSATFVLSHEAIKTHQEQIIKERGEREEERRRIYERVTLEHANTERFIDEFSKHMLSFDFAFTSTIFGSREAFESMVHSTVRKWKIENTNQRYAKLSSNGIYRW